MFNLKHPEQELKNFKVSETQVRTTQNRRHAAILTIVMVAVLLVFVASATSTQRKLPQARMLVQNVTAMTEESQTCQKKLTNQLHSLANKFPPRARLMDWLEQHPETVGDATAYDTTVDWTGRTQLRQSAISKWDMLGKIAFGSQFRARMNMERGQILILWPDNTVVTADKSTCHVLGIYVAAPTGGVDERIAHDVHARPDSCGTRAKCYRYSDIAGAQNCEVHGSSCPHDLGFGWSESSTCYYGSGINCLIYKKCDDIYNLDACHTFWPLCSRVRNHDMFGKDIASKQTSTVSGCEHACQQNPLCMCYTYNTASWWCHMKTTCSTFQSHSSAISGTCANMNRCTRFANTQAGSGYYVRLTSHPLAACEKRCWQEARCKSYFVDTDTDTCFLSSYCDPIWYKRTAGLTPKWVSGACPTKIPCKRYSAADYSGGDYKSVTSISSVEVCEVYCASETSCKCYTYNTQTKICWMKSSCGSRTFTEVATSGTCN